MDAADPTSKPPSPGGRDTRSLLVMAAMVVAAGLACYAVKGAEGVLRSLQSDLDLLLLMVPRMAAAVVIGGFVQALVPKGVIAKWLGEGAGLRGFALATLAGTLTPGGPMLSFPLVVGLKAAGAGYPALVAYLTAWALLGVQRIVTWEIPLFGGEFALARFLASLPFSVLAGFLTQALLARLRPVT